jgi:prepilin-type N-terminal cleavage/methylation domain-containing protein/prepilin-type processing-associated H-X9-DG protein
MKLHPAHPAHVRHPHGITLIEVLVVVTIITVLLALLLPALGQARSVAMRVQCGSNLRQQGVAIFAYCQDNKRKFPSTERWEAEWMIKIKEYMGFIGHPKYPTISGRVGFPHSIDRLVPAFQCPQTKTWPAISYYNGTYGINLLTVSPESMPGLSNNTMPYGRKINTLINPPSSVHLVSDCFVYNIEQWSQISNSVDPNFSRPRHHQMKANILFMDGHVDLLGEGEKRELFMADEPTRIPNGWW